ncbi:MAG: CvpA family protein [Methylococcales bacterium]|nr:CvpA family protein [Methylococcales bacterium]
MIWIDYCIIGLIFISSLFGLLRGFIKEAFSLFIWLSAIWVSVTFNTKLAYFFTDAINSSELRLAIAFIFLFFGTLFLGVLLNSLLSELVKKTGITGSDRLIGMIFGIFRGLILISILVIIAGLTPLPENTWWKKSTLILPFQSLAIWFRDHLPSDLTDAINF